MEVEYRKDLRHNYMVIHEEEAIRTEPYCIRLLEQQQLEGILPLKLRQMNDRLLFYYDITGMQSMKSLLEKSILSYDKIKLIINGILHTLDTAYEFLLPGEDFILKPDYIYLDVMSFTPALCFLSGYHSEIKEQMNYLLEYLMNKVDYSDKDAVLLIYQLYAASREESFTTMHLYASLNSTRGSGLPDTGRSDSEKETVSTGLSVKEKLVIPEDKLLMEKIPVMLEKVEREEEKVYYPLSSYLLTAFCAIIGGLLLILGITTGILYDPFGERIVYSKLAALLLILLCIEGYVLRKIWDRKNKVSKIVSRNEYIDPLIEQENTGSQSSRKKPAFAAKLNEEAEKTESEITRTWEKALPIRDEEQQEENYNPTCLLSDISKDTEDPLLCLNPRQGSDYEPILLTEYPFFIGKLKANVDYCLDQKVISRFHAKITKEEESYYITDLNSTNGTYVNGRLLQTYEKKELILGDEIAFANLPYVFGTADKRVGRPRPETGDI